MQPISLQVTMLSQPRTILDLSHPLQSGQVPACAGHPCFAASSVLSISKGNDANVHALALGTHTGTHLDAPSHFFTDGTPVDALDLSLLVAAPAIVADVRHKGTPHARIVFEDIASAVDEARRREVRMLLLCTGWSHNWGKGNYTDHPFLDVNAARRLWDAGVRVIGLDTQSPDQVAPGFEGKDVHLVFLGSGGIIVENLNGLERILERGWANVVVSMLPLRLAGLDGSPLRAVAWEGSN